MSALAALRSRAGALLVDGFFRAASAAGRLHPAARPDRHDLLVLDDIPYVERDDGGGREHRLDIYVPKRAARPLPVVLYVHGGGFRILSKETHWLPAIAFARKGYLVFNISYRLAPEHPFPAALEDACAAYRFVVEHAADHGGDLSRLVIAGESAGANLALALALAATYERPEPHARRVFETGVVPKAVLPACGILQVSDTERLHRRKPLRAFVRDRLAEVERAYLGRAARGTAMRELADPLLVLERGQAPARPFPAVFAPVGTADPLLDDTRRLKVALDRLGVPCETAYYEGEPHAFHAFVFREAARRCWRDMHGFLARHLAAADATTPSDEARP